MSAGLLITLVLTVAFFVFRSFPKTEHRSDIDVYLGDLDDDLLREQGMINDKKEKQK